MCSKRSLKNYFPLGDKYIMKALRPANNDPTITEEEQPDGTQMTWPQVKEARCRQAFLCNRSPGHPYQIGLRWWGHALSKIQEVSPYFTFRKYYSMLSHGWWISNHPNFCLPPIPTSPSSPNPFSHTPALPLSLFISLWHSLTYLCLTTIFKHLLWCQSVRTVSEVVSVGRVWQRNLLRGGLDGTRLNPVALKHMGPKQPFKLVEL